MLDNFFSWWSNPLGNENGPSAVTLFLFVGLVLLCLAAWALIFRHIRESF